MTRVRPAERLADIPACTGAFYLPLGVNGYYNKSCFLRGQGNRWQKDYIASQRGAGQWLIGKCSDFVNGASGGEQIPASTDFIRIF